MTGPWVADTLGRVELGGVGRHDEFSMSAHDGQCGPSLRLGGGAQPVTSRGIRRTKSGQKVTSKRAATSGM